MMNERPIPAVPRLVIYILCASFSLQLAWHFNRSSRLAQIDNLASAPPLVVLQLVSFGDPIASAKALTLHLQAFDRQPGVQIPFSHLNYSYLQEWLSRILELDPPAQYPLLLASRVYGEVANATRQRQMLEFVYQEFQHDPNRRWPWLAHAAVLAKHRLRDLPLALKYAKAIRLSANAVEVPSWAKQMEIFLLDELNEHESARILLGGLLESGKITDPHELQFLQERLHEFAAKSAENNTGSVEKRK